MGYPREREKKPNVAKMYIVLYHPQQMFELERSLLLKRPWAVVLPCYDIPR